LLSDFAFVGVVMGSAMLAVGLLAQALPPNSDAIGNERRELMVMLAAYAEGLGVLAAVVGSLVLFVGVTSAGGVTAALLVLVPVLALGVPAVRLARPGEREGVRAATTIMVWFIGALAALASIVALMAVLIPEVDASGFDAVTLVATVIVAGAAIGIGLVGSGALQELGGSVIGSAAVDTVQVRSRAVRFAAVLEGAAVIAYVVVILVVFLRE
jgi:hypothetical protein